MILHAVAERLVIFDDNKVGVFEGTYQDFLDRVGWKDETPNEREIQRAAKTEKGISKKDLRKMRAEIVSNKSRVLNPMQKRMAEIEHSIVDLEKKVEVNTQALQDASLRGDGDNIMQLSKEMHEAQQKIESLFSELATLTEEFERRSREFDERLNEVA
jgi:ATP-binding cassette subfamily F protein 3